MTSPQPVGALRLWHSEIRNRCFRQDPARPSTWRADKLYQAACCEANGVDALRGGLPGAAHYWFDRAVQTLASATPGSTRAA